MEKIYLDNAATTFPKPPQVAQAVYRYMTQQGANIGRGCYDSAYQVEELVFETRQLLCRLFHGPDPRSVVFTKNVTESLNVLLKGLLRPGDHVIASSMEHNAVMRPLVQLEKQGCSFSRAACSAGGTLLPGRPGGLPSAQHPGGGDDPRQQRMRRPDARRPGGRVLPGSPPALHPGQRPDRPEPGPWTCRPCP